MERTKQFQILRILLIFYIFFIHCDENIFRGGLDIVSYFFVVAGFLFNRDKYPNYQNYITNRLKKIFIPYYIVLVLYLIFYYVRYEYSFVLHLFLLQSWIPSTTTCYYHYVSVSWFCSSLLFCYIFFPLFSKCVEKYTNIFAIIALCGIFLICRFNYGNLNEWTKYINPFLRLLNFTLGYVLMLKIRNIEPQKTSFWIPFLGIIIYLGILLKCRSYMFISISSVAIIYILYIYKNRLFDTLFCNNLVLFLAKNAIYFYLVHQVVIGYIFWTLREHSPIVKYVLSLVLTLMFSIIIGKCTKMINKLLDK